MFTAYCIISVCVLIVGLAFYYLSKEAGPKGWIGEPWWFIPESGYEPFFYILITASFFWPFIAVIFLVILTFILPARGLAWVIKHIFYGGSFR